MDISDRAYIELNKGSVDKEGMVLGDSFSPMGSSD